MALKYRKLHGAHQTTATTLPQVEIEVVRGRARQKKRTLETSVYLIGSADDCDLVLRDNQFPDVFAYIVRTATSVQLRHLEFYPELTVNGNPAHYLELQDGDRLRAGPFEFVIRIQFSSNWFSPHHFGPHTWAQNENAASPTLPKEKQETYQDAHAEMSHLLRTVQEEVLGTTRLKLFAGEKHPEREGLPRRRSQEQIPPSVG